MIWGYINMGIFKNPFKKEKKDNAKLSNAGSTTVKVSVYRIVGKALRMEVLRFTATQDKDRSGNLILTNPEFDFREDIDFIKEKVIEDLEYRLEVLGGTKVEKIKKVEEAIKEQESRIKNIREGRLTIIAEDGKEQVFNVNPIDEDVKLTQLKVLRDSLKVEGNSSHEFIDVEGHRNISYKFEEGVLFPIVYYDKEATLTPDKTARRKNYKSEQDLIDTEYMQDKVNPFTGIGKVILWILFVVLFVGNVWWATNNAERSAEITAMWDESYMAEVLKASEQSALKCSAYLSYSADANKEIIDWAILQLNKTETNINTRNIIDAR